MRRLPNRKPQRRTESPAHVPAGDGTLTRGLVKANTATVPQGTGALATTPIVDAVLRGRHFFSKAAEQPRARPCWHHSDMLTCAISAVAGCTTQQESSGKRKSTATRADTTEFSCAAAPSWHIPTCPPQPAQWAPPPVCGTQCFPAAPDAGATAAAPGSAPARAGGYTLWLAGAPPAALLWELASTAGRPCARPWQEVGKRAQSAGDRVWRAARSVSSLCTAILFRRGGGGRGGGWRGPPLPEYSARPPVVYLAMARRARLHGLQERPAARVTGGRMQLIGALGSCRPPRLGPVAAARRRCVAPPATTLVENCPNGSPGTLCARVGATQLLEI